MTRNGSLKAYKKILDAQHEMKAYERALRAHGQPMNISTSS